MEAGAPGKKRKREEFEVDYIEEAFLSEIEAYSAEHEANDEEFRIAFKFIKKELTDHFAEVRSQIIDNIALKKTLSSLQEQQKAVRLGTLEAKKERTAIQQDLYELEMDHYIGNQERLALESLNDFVSDLDVALQEAHRTINSSAGIKEKPQDTRLLKRPKQSGTKAQIDSQNPESDIRLNEIQSANFGANVSRLKLFFQQMGSLKNTADRFEAMELKLLNLKSS